MENIKILNGEFLISFKDVTDYPERGYVTPMSLIEINGIPISGVYGKSSVCSNDEHYFALQEYVDNSSLMSRIMILDLKKKKFLNGPIHQRPIVNWTMYTPPLKFGCLAFNKNEFTYELTEYDLHHESRNIRRKFKLDLKELGQNWHSLEVKRDCEDYLTPMLDSFEVLKC